MPASAANQEGPDSANFAGATVVAFESRMASETAALIERFGGVPIVAPAMREAPLDDNPAAFDFAARLLSGGFDIVLFLTGVGVRELFRVIETRYPRDDSRRSSPTNTDCRAWPQAGCRAPYVRNRS